MRRTATKLSVFVVLVAFMVNLQIVIATQVSAGEGYGTNYPGGNEDCMAGDLPPAGTSVFINYLVDYNATT